MRVIKDFQLYLGEIEKLARRISPEQRKKLHTILASMLTLLICMRKSSKLGDFDIERWYEEQQK